MNKKTKIYFPALGLLLLYLFSMVPMVLIHHHEHQAVSFFDADSCQKAIYYGVQDNHEGHLSQIQDKCLLCDHHTPPPQLLFETRFSFITTTFHAEYFCGYESLHSIDLIGNSNKDPPVI